MKKINLIPLVGVEIDNYGIIELGKSEAEIQKILGISIKSPFENVLTYQDYHINFWLDKYNNVNYIEAVNNFISKDIIVSIYGVNPFQMFATNLVEFLTEKNNGLMIGNATRNSYSFLNISVGLWRRESEISIEEEVARAKENGSYEDIKDYVELDLEKVNYYSTIGVGIRKFYNIEY